MKLTPISELTKIAKSKGLKYEEIGFSNQKNKKYYVVVDDKKIHFGDNRYEDYTQHGDKDRRRLYRLRHKNDKINDDSKPGYWSYWLLW